MGEYEEVCQTYNGEPIFANHNTNSSTYLYFAEEQNSWIISGHLESSKAFAGLYSNSCDSDSQKWNIFNGEVI